MTNGIKDIIAFSAMNTYFDIITTRIDEVKNNAPAVVYVEDFVSYILQLFHNNGLAINKDSYDIIMDTITDILSVYFQLCGVTATVRWSDDMCYVFF